MKTIRILFIIICLMNFMVSHAQIRCPDPNFDSDGDGVCDDVDICQGGDDNIDSDFDEIPDFCDACPYSIDQDCCIDINVKVFLEGPFDTGSGLMRTGLNDLDILPGETIGGVISTVVGQPYNTPPWDYIGTEGATWSNTDYAPDVVDWILISLRSSALATDEVARAAGLLMNDGQIVLVENCALTNNDNDSLHIAIEHRNHMHIMTEDKIPIINGIITYDFTTYSNPIVGINKQTPVGSGIWAMFTGDAIQEGDINGNDKVIWNVDNGIFLNYLPSDFNMDGDVNGADKALWSVNNGEFTLIPR